MRLNNTTTNTRTYQAYLRQPPENPADQNNALSNVPNIDSRLSLAQPPGANSNRAQLGVGSRGSQVTDLQNALIDAGYDPGTADGIFGSNTLSALQEYQQDRIDSLENSIRNGPPPAARSELTRQVSEFKSELGNDVAGSETLSQLDVGSADNVVDRPDSGPDEVNILQRGDTGSAVESLQEDLNAAGYNSGPTDGDFGPKTEAALQQFQQDRIDYLNGVQNLPMPPPDHAIISFEIARLENEFNSGVAGAETRQQLDRALESRTIDEPEVPVAGPGGPIPLTGDPVSDDRIAALHPEIQQRSAAFVNEVKQELGIQLRVTDGLRTFAEQDALYAQGRTAPGPRVTGARGGQSYHNYGLAIDVVELRPDGSVNYGVDYDAIAEIGERYGFEWGGNFTNLDDQPHFQFTNGLHWSELLERSNNGANPYVDLD